MSLKALYPSGLVVMNKKVSLIYWLPVENADSCIEQAVTPKAPPNTLKGDKHKLF